MITKADARATAALLLDTATQDLALDPCGCTPEVHCAVALRFAEEDCQRAGHYDSDVASSYAALRSALADLTGNEAHRRP